MDRCFKLNENRWIGEGHPCFIIAEIGQNHQGDLEIAKQLITIAKQCGADCVKFQKSDMEAKFTKGVLARKYESHHAFGKTYGEHKRYLEFSVDQYNELRSYAMSVGILFTCSAMDEVKSSILHEKFKLIPSFKGFLGFSSQSWCSIYQNWIRRCQQYVSPGEGC